MIPGNAVMTSERATRPINHFAYSICEHRKTLDQHHFEVKRPRRFFTRRFYLWAVSTLAPRMDHSHDLISCTDAGAEFELLARSIKNSAAAPRHLSARTPRTSS